jgi:hypothetical protein
LLPALVWNSTVPYSNCRSGLVTHPRITLTVNAGGGIKVPMDDTWGMRVDARWFKSSGRSASSEHWRVAHGISWGQRKR